MSVQSNVYNDIDREFEAMYQSLQTDPLFKTMEKKLNEAAVALAKTKSPCAINRNIQAFHTPSTKLTLIEKIKNTPVKTSSPLVKQVPPDCMTQTVAANSSDHQSYPTTSMPTQACFPRILSPIPTPTQIPAVVKSGASIAALKQVHVKEVEKVSAPRRVATVQIFDQPKVPFPCPRNEPVIPPEVTASQKNEGVAFPLGERLTAGDLSSINNPALSENCNRYKDQLPDVDPHEMEDVPLGNGQIVDKEEAAVHVNIGAPSDIALSTKGVESSGDSDDPQDMTAEESQEQEARKPLRLRKTKQSQKPSRENGKHDGENSVEAVSFKPGTVREKDISPCTLHQTRPRTRHVSKVRFQDQDDKREVITRQRRKKSGEKNVKELGKQNGDANDADIQQDVSSRTEKRRTRSSTVVRMRDEGSQESLDGKGTPYQESLDGKGTACQESLDGKGTPYQESLDGKGTACQESLDGKGTAYQESLDGKGTAYQESLDRKRTPDNKSLDGKETPEGENSTVMDASSGSSRKGNSRRPLRRRCASVPEAVKHSAKKADDNDMKVFDEWFIRLHRGRIKLKGHIRGMPADEFWKSSVITSRLKDKLVATTSGSKYRLLGNLRTTSSVLEGVPRGLCRVFHKGFPANWQELLKHFLQDNGERKGVTENSKKVNSTSEIVKRDCENGNQLKIDVENLPRTASGRRVYPPLAHWANQRVCCYSSSQQSELSIGSPDLLATPVGSSRSIKREKAVSIRCKSSSSREVVRPSSGTSSVKKSRKKEGMTGNNRISETDIAASERELSQEKAYSHNLSKTLQVMETEDGISETDLKKQGPGDPLNLRGDVLEIINNQRKSRQEKMSMRKRTARYNRKSDPDDKLRGVGDDQPDQPCTPASRGVPRDVLASRDRSAVQPSLRSDEYLDKESGDDILATPFSIHSSGKSRSSRKTRSQPSQEASPAKDTQKQPTTRRRSRVSGTGNSDKQSVDSNDAAKPLIGKKPVSKAVKSGKATKKSWTAKQVKSLKSACTEIGEDVEDRWDRVAELVGSHTASECQQHFSSLPCNKPSLHRRAATIPGILTAGKGTMKRKRQIRQIVENLEKDHCDDLFDATPFKKLKKLPLENLSSSPYVNDNSSAAYRTPRPYNTHHNFQTDTPGPVAAFTSPGILVTADRSLADKYLHRIMKGGPTRVAPSVTPTSSLVRKVLRPSNIEANVCPSLFHQKPASDCDTDEEDDFYFSDDD